MAEWLRAFALEAGRLGSIFSRVKPKTLKLVSTATLAKRSVKVLAIRAGILMLESQLRFSNKCEKMNFWIPKMLKLTFVPSFYYQK